MAGDVIDATVAWLRLQPLRSRIAWTSDHLTAAQPWTGGWADVRGVDTPNALSDQVLWTIQLPHRFCDDDTCPHTGRALRDAFDWEPDLDRYEVHEPDPAYWETSTTPDGVDYSTGPVVVDVAAPLGGALSAGDQVRVDQALGAGSGGRRLMRSGGWSAPALSSALTRWAETYAGRTDLAFTWHPAGDSAMPVRPD